MEYVNISVSFTYILAWVPRFSYRGHIWRC